MLALDIKKRYEYNPEFFRIVQYWCFCLAIELLRPLVNSLYTVSVCNAGFLVNIWRVKDQAKIFIRDVI